MSKLYLIPSSSVVVDRTSKPLGRGGFGIVRKGTWCGSQVAVKILSDQALTERELNDFRLEANILAFLGIIDEPGHYALVMELIPNGSLFDLITKGESLAWDERRRIARDIACGMFCLHEANVLHCDLKSLNVLLAHDGSAKVADFGLSHIRRSSLSKDYHRTSGGTLPWKAPELFTFTPKYTKECDVFSYGITLTELFTMAGPYGVNYYELDVDILVDLCWVHDPKQRPPFSRIVERFDGFGSAPVYHSARDELYFTPPTPTATPPPKSASTSSSESAALIVNPTDLEKLYEMGRALDPEYGDDKSRNHSAAFECYHRAAIAGHPASQVAVGYKLERGLGVGKNAAKAVEWYQKAADRGDPRAQYNLGCCYEKGDGVWRNTQRNKDSCQREVNLGYCYQNGLGVEEDERKGVKWFRKAANQGDPSGQYNLGWCYQEGVGVGKDLKMAVHWYEKAAKQGHAAAQNNLGSCYDQGIGVRKDEKKAVEWYKMAAEQGNAAGQYNLGVCYQFEKHRTRAVEWYRKAAAQGHPQAIDALAKLGVRV
ncbi:hypothetical protein HK104_010079 [Borealophlyctis nickersoniae]|nr:hypothetical protein HK104_010079 [Borealophlyctis nickersoniae]